MAGCCDCIADDGGCCHIVFKKGWKILLFPGEIERISGITGKVPSEFVDTGPICSSQMEWYVDRFSREDPLWVHLVSEWEQPSGLVGRCPFLQQQGCALPYEGKPFICQIYPLDFNLTHGYSYLPKDTDCPAAIETRSVEGVLEYFNDDHEALERRHQAFRQDCLTLLGMVEKARVRSKWGRA